MATSVAAGGKLSLARDKGVALPPGWALDEAGQPTTDAQRAKILVPFGGPKGSGLAMMFETLTSLMVGNPLLGPALFREPGAGRHRQNSVVAAVDIAAFTDLAQYRAEVDRLIDGLKALPRAEGVSEVLVPGEPEDRSAEERGRHGIPLPAGTVENLRARPRASGCRCPRVSEARPTPLPGPPAWHSSGCGVHSGLVEPYAEIPPSELKRRLDAGEPRRSSTSASPGSTSSPRSRALGSSRWTSSSGASTSWTRSGRSSSTATTGSARRPWSSGSGARTSRPLNLRGGIDAWAAEVDPALRRY